MRPYSVSPRPEVNAIVSRDLLVCRCCASFKLSLRAVRAAPAMLSVCNLRD